MNNSTRTSLRNWVSTTFCLSSASPFPSLSFLLRGAIFSRIPINDASSFNDRTAGKRNIGQWGLFHSNLLQWDVTRVWHIIHIPLRVHVQKINHVIPCRQDAGGRFWNHKSASTYCQSVHSSSVFRAARVLTATLVSVLLIVWSLTVTEFDISSISEKSLIFIVLKKKSDTFVVLQRNQWAVVVSYLILWLKLELVFDKLWDIVVIVTR